MQNLVYAFALAMASFNAFAGPLAPRPLSEPGSLELLGVAGVVAVVVALRNRRK
jgi:hypothetical protein